MPRPRRNVVQPSDRGVEESMYFRDPNGVNVELYREELGIFDGRRLLG